MKGNGWNDIGYNFLVDKYGQVFEGRFGGMTRNVIGAHAEGFNTGSVGVALIGNYALGDADRRRRRRRSCELLAWRLDVAHVDPLSTLQLALAAATHASRAASPSRCARSSATATRASRAVPGDRTYALLAGARAARSRSTGLPKLYAPRRARARPAGTVRFTGRRLGAVPWAVTVRDATGATVAEGVGLGPTLDWTWDATSARPPGSYTWTIGGDGIRPGDRARSAARRRPRSTLTRVTGDAVRGHARTATASTTRPRSRTASACRATVTATLSTRPAPQLATLFSEPKLAGDQSFDVHPAGARGRHATGSC